MAVTRNPTAVIWPAKTNSITKARSSQPIHTPAFEARHGSAKLARETIREQGHERSPALQIYDGADHHAQKPEQAMARVRGQPSPQAFNVCVGKDDPQPQHKGELRRLIGENCAERGMRQPALDQIGQDLRQDDGADDQGLNTPGDRNDADRAGETAQSYSKVRQADRRADGEFDYDMRCNQDRQGFQHERPAYGQIET